MTEQRIALVTGANQGIGYAFVRELATRMNEEDLVLLTGRDPDRVATAVAELADSEAGMARVEGRVLDVTDGEAVAALARELGAVDIVISNAVGPLHPDRTQAEQADVFIDVANLGAQAVLREFGPILRPGGRLIVVASSLGTLEQLPERAVGAVRRGDAGRGRAGGRGVAGRDSRRDGRGEGLAGVDQLPVEGGSGGRGTGRRGGSPYAGPRGRDPGRVGLPGAGGHPRVPAVVRRLQPGEVPGRGGQADRRRHPGRPRPIRRCTANSSATAKSSRGSRPRGEITPQYSSSRSSHKVRTC